MNGIRFKPTILAAMCASMLSACGGGGDGSSTGAPANSTPPANNSALTGKAIDGYLVGAKVCLDTNANGVCDTGEPAGVTNATGDYSIPYTGDASGQRLLVQVTPETRDLSRPEGFRFPAGFTLSAVAGATTNQHISPLTTMVAAQMDAGMTAAEAIAAVQALLGGPVDPSANYVANGDAGTATIAAQIVDKITSMAPSGAADSATVRSVLNAIIAKGDVASVTQADVDTQAAKPVYSQVDASQVLVSPLFSLVDAYTNLDAPTQRIEQIVDSQLKTSYQTRDVGGTVWKDHPIDKQTSYIEPKVQFVMKPDGTWTQMLTPADWRAPVVLSSVGRTLKGKDPVTGIGVTFEERSVDLSNKPSTLGVTGTLFGRDTSLYPALSSPFPAGTVGYLGIKSFAEDYVVLPLGSSNAICEFPYTKAGSCAYTTYATRPNFPPYDTDRPYYDPNVPQNDPSLPSPLTSVQQLVGTSLVDNQIIGATVDIQVGGKATIRMEFDPRTPDDDKVFTATWKVYARNQNVLVFDIARADAELLATNSDGPGPLVEGAKFILAIRNGQLQSGLLFPAGYGQRTVQFAKALPSILTTPVPYPQ